MSYYSTIGAAIGGSPEQINALHQTIQSQNITDTSKILAQFKIVSIDTDFSVFAFYIDSIQWPYEAECLWDKLCQIASELELPYVFYRMGESVDDNEDYSNHYETNFDEQMLDLFAFNFCLAVNPAIQSSFMD